ncbi:MULTISPECIES: hypothetical protein [Stenotrophomonas]|uniref:hypothetical protein n=1 Tax=Stenotrophomonas TaxID=40323 RepID=UPI0018D3F8C8|nr:hypothetical protein [Stenotrophomonas geniculata]MBH1409332.1 hypothetical protein [Stenotrophomonas maltophilia]HDS1299615.1 hypothetical protein [Stenotrophomonas maltophilia]HDS1524328.1 hypothetical protein [Stenotrophomonas maltophilia]HDS1659547.1 hypothetical protein [Stenotrophomonas maltophilia]HDS1673154.1 hypothetical protein [Stenotrophomonas maltophilia]
MNKDGREVLETILGGKIEQRADRIAPGINPVAGVEVVYFEADKTTRAARQFDALQDSAGELTASSGGIVSDSCRITLPNGQCFRALSFHGDLDGWRKAVEAGARTLGLRLARIEDDHLIISDGQSVPLSECEVDLG